MENGECASLRCEPVTYTTRICAPSGRSIVCSSGAVTPGTGRFIPPSPTGSGGAGGASGTPPI